MKVQDSKVLMKVLNRSLINGQFDVNRAELEVSLSATTDIRGSLLMHKLTPGEFQKMKGEVKIRVNEGTQPRQLECPSAVAKACCKNNKRVNTFERC